MELSQCGAILPFCSPKGHSLFRDFEKWGSLSSGFCQRMCSWGDSSLCGKRKTGMSSCTLGPALTALVLLFQLFLPGSVWQQPSSLFRYWVSPCGHPGTAWYFWVCSSPWKVWYSVCWKVLASKDEDLCQKKKKSTTVLFAFVFWWWWGRRFSNLL